MNLPPRRSRGQHVSRQRLGYQDSVLVYVNDNNCPVSSDVSVLTEVIKRIVILRLLDILRFSLSEELETLCSKETSKGFKRENNPESTYDTSTNVQWDALSKQASASHNFVRCVYNMLSPFVLRDINNNIGRCVITLPISIKTREKRAGRSDCCDLWFWPQVKHHVVMIHKTIFFLGRLEPLIASW